MGDELESGEKPIKIKLKKSTKKIGFIDRDSNDELGNQNGIKKKRKSTKNSIFDDQASNDELRDEKIIKKKRKYVKKSMKKEEEEHFEDFEGIKSELNSDINDWGSDAKEFYQFESIYDDDQVSYDELSENENVIKSKRKKSTKYRISKDELESGEKPI